MAHKYPNFILSQLIDDVDIPDNSHDDVIIHYVLHEIGPDSRDNILKILKGKLKKWWKNAYLREPIGDNHGISTIEIKKLIQKKGLK